MSDFVSIQSGVVQIYPAFAVVDNPSKELFAQLICVFPHHHHIIMNKTLYRRPYIMKTYS